MNERSNKASICSVVYLDIPDQSSKPVFRQIQDKALFDSIINEAIRDVTPDDRILMDTGNGAALALFGAPEVAIFIAMMIRDAVVEHNKANEEKLAMRAGIGIGPVRVEDISSLPGIQGEGVKAAERMKNLAGPNQILVSRAFHDITSGLTDEIAGMFYPFEGGHEAYAIRSPEQEPFVAESAAELADTTPLMSRLLHSEDSSHFGLWGSAALAAIVVLVGGFFLIANLLRPDLGVVIADSKPTAPAADLRAVSVPAAAATEAPAMPEADLGLAESGGHEPVVESTAPQTVTALESEAQLPSTQTSTKKRKRTRSMETVEKIESETALPEISEPVLEVAEPIQEEPVVVPQEEPKKVAASPPPRNGPAVEERRIPVGERGKTLWDDFRKSFKQGTTQHVCTQAEIALNQCK